MVDTILKQELLNKQYLTFYNPVHPIKTLTFLYNNNHKERLKCYTKNRLVLRSLPRGKEISEKTMTLPRITAKQTGMYS